MRIVPVASAIALALVSSLSAAQTAPEPAPAPAAPAAPTSEPPAAPSSIDTTAAPSYPDRPPVEEGEKREERAHPGFVMSFQTGYAIPLGKIAENGSAVSDGFSGQVPLWIELGGNVTPSLFLGLYGALAFGGVTGDIADICSKNALDCSAHSFRGGVAIRYRFLAGEPVQPWFGYGAGYEALVMTASAGAQSVSLSYTGWELAHLSGGVDFKVGSGWTLGPAIDLAIGEYTHAHAEGTNTTTRDADITSTATHQWMTFGLRASVMP